jgi:hypothetical protein
MVNFLVYTKQFPKTIILNYICQMVKEIHIFFCYVAYLDRTIFSKPPLLKILLLLDTLKFYQNIVHCSKGNLIFLALMFSLHHHISVEYLHFEDLNVQSFAIKMKNLCYLNVVYVKELR